MKELTLFELEHPLLGRLTGLRRNKNVVQFRGIPYGRIPMRFRQAIPVEKLLPEELDCTKYGFACPQIEQGKDAFGGSIPGESERRYDEFSCLNLTVAAPFSSGGLEYSNLPVMVYVHGGGFAEGAHYGMVHGM